MSSNTNWTPDPWTVGHFIPEDGVYPTHEHEADRLYGCYEVEEACDHIKNLTDDGEVHEAYRVAEANRNLIAAAPALYQTLEMVRDAARDAVADDVTAEWALETARRIDKALALARGEAGDD